MTVGVKYALEPRMWLYNDVFFTYHIYIYIYAMCVWGSLVHPSVLIPRHLEKLLVDM